MVRFVGRGRTYPAWQIAVGLLLLAVFILLAFWFMAEGPGARLISPPGSVIADFEGSADEVTESFDVRRGWRVQWSTTDEMTIAIRGEQNMGTVVTTDGPDSGTTDPPAGGVFYLEVDGEGDWTITILQGD